MKVKPEHASNTPKAKRPRGRPCLYTDAIGADILDRIGKGETLTDICAGEGMPGTRAVNEWCDEKTRPPQVPPSFGADFASARARGFDAIAASTLQIADDGRNDWMEQNGEDSPGWKLNGEHVQRSKLRIETRLKLLAKWDPKRYGDKSQVEHSGGLTLEQMLLAAEKPPEGG